MITTAAAALAVSVPASAGAQQDLRNPDRQAPVASQQDLRNPDRQAPVAPRQPQDLRNADQRVGSYSTETVVQPPVTVAQPTSSFQWGDAVIGAAGMLGLLSLCAGTAITAAHFRRRRRHPAASH